MTTSTEAQIKSAAAILISQNQTLTTEQAEQLARAVIEASQSPAGGPIPKPATPATAPPPVPRIDVAALANASPAERAAAWRKHERDLAGWIPVRQSYEEPINETAVAARARLTELRTMSDAATDAERASRALERERLMQVVLAGGGAS
jgi:hypothetical protein